jgi:hypothetical protein
MKPFISYSLLAAAAACGLAFGQAYTTPVGYNTTPLLQGFNALGLTLQTPAIAAGTFETVAGKTLADTNVTFAPQAGRTYVLEITSGPAVGSIQEVPAASISGNTITTPDDLQAQGLTTAHTYKLRVAPTLEEIFTTTSLTNGGVLGSGLNSGTADVIWIPKGDGGYDQYFLHNSGEFRRAGTTTPTPNVPVVYADGFLVQKKGTGAASLTVSGEVKTVGTNSILVQGFNLVSVVAPVGMNLWNSGLEDDLGAGLNSGTADLVWVQQPNLSYKTYFRHSSGNWRDADAATVNLTQAQAEAVNMSLGFLVQKKGAVPSVLDLNVPASYSSL